MKEIKSKDSFGASAELETKSGKILYYRLGTLTEKGIADISRLPFSIKVLVEALIRSENGMDVTKDDVLSLANYNPQSPPHVEIPFKPARVLLQDFTGVPCVVDLAAMRSVMTRFGRNPERINPQIPVDLVIDHSVQVDCYNSSQALKQNTALEFERNRERHEFLPGAKKLSRTFV